MKLLFTSDQEYRIFEVNSSTFVGGAQCSGIKLKLQSPADYAFVEQNKDGVLIHSTERGQKQPIEITKTGSAKIRDLQIYLFDTQVSSDSEERASIFDSLLNMFQDPKDLSFGLNEVLNIVREQFSLEKGLIVTKKTTGEFELEVSQGVQKEDPWLSESLITQTISECRPIEIRNLVGSEFESSQSLMATGFLSVYSWPIVLRGEILGVLVCGSTRPHSGLSSRQKLQIQQMIKLCSIFLDFSLENKSLREQISASQKSSSKSPLLTTHPGLLKTIDLAKKVAPSDLSVLILGETGVGKDVVARWLHKNSDRKSCEFVSVNCGSIPAELLESTLFGHKKGAFTGALSDKIGKFEVADGGTLFLDELGDLPLPLQVKLLHVLQDKTIEPVGSTQRKKVDVRVVAATHKNILKMIEDGEFREDLYYRLAEVSLNIPPLKERRYDVPILAKSFLAELAPGKKFGTEAWEWLKVKDWRGNVRELKAAVRRGAILAEGTEISKSDLCIEESPSQSIKGEQWLGGRTLEEAKSEFIKEKISIALAKTDGNKKQAADLLGISTRTMFRYLENQETSP